MSEKWKAPTDNKERTLTDKKEPIVPTETDNQTMWFFELLVSLSGGIILVMDIEVAQ